MPQSGLIAAKELFWTELNYDRVNEPLSRRNWPDRAHDALDDDPVLLAQHESSFGAFDVIYAKLSPEQRGRGFPLSLTAERLAVNQLLNDHPYALFVFSDTDEQHWHLVNVRYDEETARQRVLRRIAVGPYERLRTASERVSMLDLTTLDRDLFGLAPLDIQRRHDEAFNVEAVTDQFFKDYQGVFNKLQVELLTQAGDPSWAHDFALQFLNRLMFMYYVQRKRWLGDDPDFLCNFWRAYRKSERPDDTFVEEWLQVLFFEAFNNRFQAGRSDYEYFPPEIRDALAMAPFLNGGLFERNDLDRAHSPTLTDGLFEKAFDFLEGYNFTISEDTPLDQEVAVDPEMIGKVYESLVNVSEEADERGEAGIFYTPRVEIDLMCRLSLVDWLSNHLGQSAKPLLYEAVFAFDPEDKERADAALAGQDLWPRLNDLLRNVTVVDPACGSGSFLVGMLYVLDDLVARADDQLGQDETPYDRKQRIIGSSLYGVDVMDWAVHVAELRLWLQLVVDTELEPAELKFRPLLPNLSFKLRPGDSLVQEVGGMNLALRKGSRLIPPALKGRVTQLKGEKRKFYNNDPDRKYHTEKQVQQAELQLFRDILDARAKAIDERLKEIDDALRPQVNLFGEIQDSQTGLERPALQQERDRLETEREQVRRARQALQTAKDVPFVWDIAFVEVFEGADGGFDIVIGNPPYVRHELIRDPQETSDEVTAADRRAYKGKLARSVYSAWPRAFGFDWSRDRASRQLHAKNDLYVYFYLHGLSLLNEKGSFCFITSNSWLDVGYGKDLQEFLLTRGCVKMVIDNQARRSFASADINTIIVLLGAARDGSIVRPTSMQHIARFVMLAVPFEETLSPVVWEEVNEATKRHTTHEYRVFPLKQCDLLDYGTDPEKRQFAGDKWGGKYLRAPDITFTLLEKGRHKLVKLAQIINVETYLNTGGADGFFIVRPADNKRRDETVHILSTTGEIFEIEAEWVRPFVKSPSEITRILIKEEHANWLLVVPPDTVDSSSQMWRYIGWGEEQGYHERSGCRRRSPWWRLPSQATNPGVVVWSRLHHAKHLVGYNPDRISYTNFYALHSPKPKVTAAILNTSFFAFIKELMGKTNFGGGALKTDGNDVKLFPCVDFRQLTQDDEQRLVSAFDKLMEREIEPLFSEVEKPDRRSLDAVVFDFLGLTEGERDAVYEHLLGLIARRSEKAKSL